MLSELFRYGTPWPAVVQFRNELPCTADAAAQYVRFRAVLRQAGFPGLVGFGSFGVGQPDWPQYQYLAGADCVIFDEYLDRSTAGSAPFYVLRHVEAIRRGLLPADLPLFIGEWGSDALGIDDSQHRRGWQDRGKLTADEQAANLRAYLAACAPSVRAVFVFADGPTPAAPAGWADFATRGTAVEAAIRATWPAPLPNGGAIVASLPIPLDNQLTSDGPNKYNECGPACIRMVCDYFGLDVGDAIDAIDVAETGDEQYVGYTTTQQMVAWFTARGIPAVQSQPADVTAAIAANLGRGWPCIWLGYWDRAALTGGHFETPVAVDNAGAVALNNPYGGYRETLSAAEVDRYSLGWLVTIRATKEDMQMANDPLIPAAKARWELLGQGANPATAIFAAYLRRFRAYASNGNDAVLDPTPCIHGEATTPDGHVYAMFDNGEIYHYRPDTKLVYIAEWTEHDRIMHDCGWLPKAA